MADIVSSLFGLSSNDLQSQINQEAEQRALNFSSLNRDQMASYAGYKLGDTLARGLFNIQDPRIKRATQIEQLLAEAQQESQSIGQPKAMMNLSNKLSEAGFSREALAVGQQAQELGIQQSLNQGKLAEAQREAQYNQAINSLPADATDEDYLKVTKRFAPAATVLSQINKRQEAELAREQRAADVKARLEENTRQFEMRLQDQRLAREDRAALQSQLAQMQIEARKDLANLNAANIRARNPYQLSKGEEAVDRKFGNEYAEYVALGGDSVINDQLNKIDDVMSMLKTEGNITGTSVGLADKLGDTALNLASPKALEARDKIGSVVQSNLRAILGGQFAQKEGEALLARAYNINASPKDNLKRLGELRTQIESAAEAKKQSINYFEQTGTLKGFTRSPKKQDSVEVGGTKYFRPKNMSDKDWNDYKKEVGGK